MTQLIAEDMMVPSEPGIDIFVRNKRPANLGKYTPERTLLFVHGSTYPAHTGFDIPLGGQSWMETIATRGYDVYCLDVRGYGRSTRPAAMGEPPQDNPPVAYGGSSSAPQAPFGHCRRPRFAPCGAGPRWRRDSRSPRSAPHRRAWRRSTPPCRARAGSRRARPTGGSP